MNAWLWSPYIVWNEVREHTLLNCLSIVEWLNIIDYSDWWAEVWSTELGTLSNLSPHFDPAQSFMMDSVHGDKTQTQYIKSMT